MRIPIITALVAGILIFLIDLYIYCDIARGCGVTPFPFGKRGRKHRRITNRRTGTRVPSRRPSLIYLVVTLIIWIAFAWLLVYPYRMAGKDISVVMWGMYALVTIYAAKSVYVVFSLIGDVRRLWHGRPWRLGLYAGLPLAVFVFIYLWYGVFVTRHKIDVKEVTIVSERLPQGFDGFRIVQVSDLHVGTWDGDTRFVSRLVDSINAHKPEVIFFTGDLVNRETTELAPFLSTLSRLTAPYGVYSILGNHDYGDYVSWDNPADKRSNLELLKAWQRQIGWRMLNNSRTFLRQNGDSIMILGVENWGEPPFHQYGHLTDALPLSRDSVHHLNDGNFKILLTHNPEHWRREASKISNVDLTLCGHTHAMQMIFRAGKWRWSPSAMMYEEWSGLYVKDGGLKRERRGDSGNAGNEEDGKKTSQKYVYVNIGAGEVGMPYRLGGAVPEVTVITLRRPARHVHSSPAQSV